MGQNLTKLCYEECLRHLRELPQSVHWKILLHTLKANVHALGLIQLAHEIHNLESQKISPKDLPLERWKAEIKKLDVEEKTWSETLNTIAKEANKVLHFHWHGPKLEELSSIVLHLARNTIAHGKGQELNLWVEVKQRGPNWHVQIRDDGGGLSFENRSKDLLSGQGVGLEFVRQTLKNWGGNCGILSNPGQGLVITLQYPIAQAAPIKKAA
jgi:chemotaxis protein histidine kinase CheA